MTYSDWYGLDLLDHPSTYRRCGVKGPATWKNTVLIGESYNVFDHDGTIGMGAIEEASRILRQGATVWARPDLSMWRPPSTNLAIVSPALANLNPADFGFIDLSRTQ